MAESDNHLLVPLLRELVAAARAGAPAEQDWRDAAAVFAAQAWDDAEVASALARREASVLERRLREWESGAQAYPPSDRAILKRALKAFRKRLKLQQLDEESGLGGGPFSGGRRSRLVAIRPPDGYSVEVWRELEVRGHLRHDGHGCYELRED